MKVIHILQNYEPSKGGTQFLFKNISEILIKKYNDEVLVYTTNSMFDPGSDTFQLIEPNFEIINNVSIHRFPFYRFHRVFLKNFNKLLFKILGHKSYYISSISVGPYSPMFKDSLRDNKCDVICGSTYHYSFMNYGIWRADYKIKNPFVFMGAIHFDDEKNISLPKHILIRINSSDKYIANTIFEKDCLIKLGIEPNKMDVIGCGVNILEFGLTTKSQARKILELSEHDFVIGYVGRFAIKKNIVTLIKAFGENYQQNWKLVLAGSQNDYLDYVKSYVNDNFKSISDRIIFIINFEESLKEKIYSCMDLFVSPSYSESFGIVFLEAWASKLPVIGTDIGAIKSVISDGQDGRLFEASNDIQLAELLLYYYENNHIRQLHGISGFNKLIQNYSWEVITEKYRNTYLEAISIFNNKDRCAG
jgi:glycosyltransferase involved in cell wall biosynthesis